MAYVVNTPSSKRAGNRFVKRAMRTLRRMLQKRHNTLFTDYIIAFDYRL